jgi:hypothetical protein
LNAITAAAVAHRARRVLGCVSTNAPDRRSNTRPARSRANVSSSGVKVELGDEPVDHHRHVVRVLPDEPPHVVR